MGGCRKFFCRGVAGYHSFFCLSNALGTDCHILLLWRKPFGFGASGRLPEALYPGGPGRDASHKPLTPTPFPPEVLAASCGWGLPSLGPSGCGKGPGPALWSQLRPWSLSPGHPILPDAGCHQSPPPQSLKPAGQSRLSGEKRL